MGKKRKSLTKEEIDVLAKYQWANVTDIMNIGGECNWITRWFAKKSGRSYKRMLQTLIGGTAKIVPMLKK